MDRMNRDVCINKGGTQNEKNLFYFDWNEVLQRIGFSGTGNEGSNPSPSGTLERTLLPVNPWIILPAVQIVRGIDHYAEDCRKRSSKAYHRQARIRLD